MLSTITYRIAPIFFVTLFVNAYALGEQIPVSVDSRCPDKSIEYKINQYAVAEVKASSAHKLVSDDSTQIIIRLSAAPVKFHGDDSPVPLGISFAVLVTEKSNDHWDVTKFQNSFVPLDNVETSVRETIRDALK